jgi:hypothetical protein
MKFAFVLLALSALAGCQPEAPVAESQEAYKFAYSPCEESDPPNGSNYTNVQYVHIGPLSDGSIMKIRSANVLAAGGPDRRVHTVSSQIVSPYSATCWDHFPDQISESWVSDSLNPPGQAGYWQGTYDTNRFVQIYGYSFAPNNSASNPSPWVRLQVKTWNGSAFVDHRWVMSDGYHWTQEY